MVHVDRHESLKLVSQMRRPWRVVSFVLLAALLVILRPGRSAQVDAPSWQRVSTYLHVSSGMPRAYALVDNGRAIVFDAPRGADLDGLKRMGVEVVDALYLTHHHRDACARAAEWLAKGIPARASRDAAAWLLPDQVARFWQESIPLRNSRTAYLVVPRGISGVECSLVGGESIPWQRWSIEVVATPGHSPDHVAYVLRRDGHPLTIICGDALASAGKMWSPYTTEWDHWTDLGLKPAAASLRKLAALQPRMLCPAHGPVIEVDAVAALEKTARAVEEVGFLKSYERYSKDRLGNAPVYPFLAKEQAGTAGEKPWSQLSPHLFLTGNTYVLVARDNALAVIDPWGKRSAEQIQRLQRERNLGPVELVTFSHAHFDHYDGVYDLPERDRFQVWTLDRVAEPIAEPFYYRAPFLDARPVRIDRRMRDGEQAAWRNYVFRFRHFPGQTYFTMGMETEIDGKRCFFTADNFFHVDLYSGTGGWMGLNRSWPSYYASSAAMVLKARPDWVLGEHGGAFAFDEEDWKRRVAWGQAAAAAADALSPSGNHRHDWDPHRLHVEPFVAAARPGATVAIRLAASNPLHHTVKRIVAIENDPVVEDVRLEMAIASNRFESFGMNVKLKPAAPPGRHVVPLVAAWDGDVDGSDLVLVVDVAKND